VEILLTRRGVRLAGEVADDAPRDALSLQLRRPAPEPQLVALAAERSGFANRSPLFHRVFLPRGAPGIRIIFGRLICDGTPGPPPTDGMAPSGGLTLMAIGIGLIGV
jgi:hypothetical protein